MFGEIAKLGGEQMVSEFKNRHALYKSRMAELAQYKKLLKQQNKKNLSKTSEMDKTQSSKHIDKYRHKQIHKSNEATNDNSKEGAVVAKTANSEDYKMPGMDPSMQK